MRDKDLLDPLVQAKKAGLGEAKQARKDLMSLSVSHCPHCIKKLDIIDSRPHFAYGFPTVRRRRVCKTCDFKITTIELPIELGNDIFKNE